MTAHPSGMRGVLRYAKKGAVRVVCFLLWPLAALLALMRIRFLIGGNVLLRIGHTALGPDLYVKTRLIGWRADYRGVLLAPKGATVNSCLLGYWSRYMKIVRHPVLVKALRLFERQACLQHDLGFINIQGDGSASQVKMIPANYRVQARYEATHRGRPVLHLSDSDEVRGRRVLRQFGMSEDAWFVCLHVREAGYLPELAYHSYRNSDIFSYLPAVEAIVERGGWVIRVGDSSMKPLPRMKQTVDYVHSALRSDWMDIFCMARCKFLLGDSSGPFVVSFAFGTPCALANYIPMGHGAYSERDLWIPKRYRSIAESRDLTFPESLRLPLRALYRTQDYEAAGIDWVDNTPEEICQLVLEMLERLDGCLFYTAEDERLQRLFKELLEADPLYGTTARVGRDFLRRHIGLLEEAPVARREGLREFDPPEEAGKASRGRSATYASPQTATNATRTHISRG